MEIKELEIKSTTTGVFNLYHQQPGDDPVHFNFVFTKRMTTEEQCFHRTMMIGSEWKELNFAWVEDPCFLWLENRTGRDLAKNPTPEQEKEIDGAIIEVAPHKLMLGSGMVNFICPSSEPIMVRSLGIDAKLKYVAIQR